GQHLQSRALCQSAARRQIARPLVIRPVCGVVDQPVAQGPFSAVSTLPGLDAARPRFFGLDAAVSIARARTAWR
ncbi:MAG TPA: hypothetical protein VK802_07375, partial [Streptosporangiaceae bacterium]|nr:hypothetical protein [Streptosporangiaceae bacterium]